MTDYSELVKFLRGLSPWAFPDASNKRMRDAADAIEKLVTLYEKAEMDATNLTGKLTQAEAQLTAATAEIEELKDMPWVESVQVDKLRQRIDELEEVACHCNVRENAELIAKILDDDVDGKAFELPKRGEWVEENRRPRSSQFVCSECHRTADDPQPTRDKAWRKRCRYAYCPNCGAKMEVQDADS